MAGPEISFKGKHGLVQFNRQTPCLSIIQTGTLASLPAQSLSFEYVTTSARRLTYTGGDMPFFALYVPEGLGSVGGILSTSKSGTTWVVDFGLEKGIPIGAGPDLNQVRYFVLDRPRLYTGSGPLAQFKDDTLKVTFSTKYPPKTPVRTAVAGKKYAAIAPIRFERNLDVDLLTTGLWQNHESIWASGIRCPTGSLPYIDKLVIYDNTTSGSGGGSSGVSTYGITAPLIAIDVTSYV